MCKINGQSVFRYMFSPVWTWHNIASTNRKVEEAAKAGAAQGKADVEEEIAKQDAETDQLRGEMPMPAVPVKTTGTGINNTTKVGLNLL